MIPITKMQEMGFELDVYTKDWNLMMPDKSTVLLTIPQEEYTKFKEVKDVTMYIAINQELNGFSNGKDYIRYEFRKLMELEKRKRRLPPS